MDNSRSLPVRPGWFQVFALILVAVIGLAGCRSTNSSDDSDGATNQKSVDASRTVRTPAQAPPADLDPAADPLGEIVSGDVIEVAAARSHSCLRTRDGYVYCWGSALHRQVPGSATTVSEPTLIPGLSDIVELAAGGRTTCARNSAGTVWCWGENSAGQAAGTDADTACGPEDHRTLCATEPQKLDLADAVAGLAVGSTSACALRRDGTVWCWGAGDHGQLGNGANQRSATPVQVSALTSVSAISGTGSHFCALRTDHTVWCWGAGDNGKLGANSSDDANVPMQVIGVLDAAGVAAGGEHTCIRRTDNTVSCWGYNHFGQLGIGTERPVRTRKPQPVAALTDVIGLSAGRYQTCAILADRAVSCWGRNLEGELADGGTDNRATPTPSPGLANVAQLSAGWAHTCAVTTASGVYCWGANTSAQLGGVDSDKDPHPQPQRLEFAA